MTTQPTTDTELIFSLRKIDDDTYRLAIGNRVKSLSDNGLEGVLRIVRDLERLLRVARDLELDIKQQAKNVQP